MCTRESLRVVLNTSPIIVLVKLGILNQALNLFCEVEVPSGLLEELEKKKDEVYQELMRAIGEGRIRVEGLKRRLPRLSLGESSAILLALTRADLLPALKGEGSRPC